MLPETFGLWRWQNKTICSILPSVFGICAPVPLQKPIVRFKSSLNWSMHTLRLTNKRSFLCEAHIFVIFSEAQNSSQVIFNTSHGCTFLKALCSDWPFFLHDFAGGCYCTPHVFCRMNNHFLINQPNSTGSPPNCLFYPIALASPRVWNC